MSVQTYIKTPYFSRAGKNQGPALIHAGKIIVKVIIAKQYEILKKLIILRFIIFSFFFVLI
jgi:hypothetical protein